MHDAVNLFMMSLSELHVTQPIITQPLYCNDTEKWSDGYRLVIYMKVVSKKKNNKRKKILNQIKIFTFNLFKN